MYLWTSGYQHCGWWQADNGVGDTAVGGARAPGVLVSEWGSQGAADRWLTAKLLEYSQCLQTYSRNH